MCTRESASIDGSTVVLNCCMQLQSRPAHYDSPPDATQALCHKTPDHPVMTLVSLTCTSIQSAMFTLYVHVRERERGRGRYPEGGRGWVEGLQQNVQSEPP